VAGINVSRGPKSDVRDAFGLADALRLGAITTPVFKAPARFALLRELSRVYTMIDTSRTTGSRILSGGLGLCDDVGARRGFRLGRDPYSRFCSRCSWLANHVATAARL
jgi:hypothetical protein